MSNPSTIASEVANFLATDEGPTTTHSTPHSAAGSKQNKRSNARQQERVVQEQLGDAAAGLTMKQRKKAAAALRAGRDVDPAALQQRTHSKQQTATGQASRPVSKAGNPNLNAAALKKSFKTEKPALNGKAAAATPTAAPPAAKPAQTDKPTNSNSTTAITKTLPLKPRDGSDLDTPQRWYDHPVFSEATQLLQKCQQSKKVLTVAQHDASVKRAREKATELLTTLLSETEKMSHKGSERRWMSTVLQNGTLTDKIAAIQLMIQESPLHRLTQIDRLLAMASKKGRREQTMAVDALKELFMNDLLPHDRRLRTFSAQPLFKYVDTTNHNTAATISNEMLVYFLLEDQIRAKYTIFIQLIASGTHDTLMYIKRQRLVQLYDLLTTCPEQEQTVLSTLVNKLGEPERQISSKVVYLLTKLLYAHPGMKANVVEEIEHLLFRPNISTKAQYYALIFLNSLVFNDADTLLAQRLIDTYFTLFHVNMKVVKPTKDEEIQHKKDERKKQLSKFKQVKQQLEAIKNNNVQQLRAISTKLLSAILVGVNRALPYAKYGSATLRADGNNQFNKHMNTLFEVVHTTTFTVALQALMLIFQVLLPTADDEEASQSTITDTPLAARYYRSVYDLLLSNDLWTSTHKHALFLNLLYKSMKYDTNVNRIAAFVRRLMQQTLQHQPPFVTAVLYMCSQLLSLPTHQTVLRLLDTPESILAHSSINGDDDDDEVETFKDVEESKSEADAVKVEDDTTVKAENGTQSNHRSTRYDPRKREPQFSNAATSCSWEIALLATHFHPSVVAFATQLLNSRTTGGIEYSGDPLTDFTATAFLDKFVYRNPKAMSDSKRHGPQLRAHARDIKTQVAAEVIDGVASTINSREWLSKHQDDGGMTSVAPDQQFYYTYFTEKARRDAEDPELRAQREEQEKYKGISLDDYADQVMEDEVARDSRVNDDDVDLDAFEDDEELRAGQLDSDDEGESEQDGEIVYADSELDAEGSDDDDEEPAEEAAEGEVEETNTSEDEAAAERAAFGSDNDDFASEQDDAAPKSKQRKSTFAVFSDDDFDFDEEMMSDEDESDVDDAVAPAAGNSKRQRSATSQAIFASAEEFADLLNNANDSGVNKKQAAWESRDERGSNRRDAGKKRRPNGGKGGKQQKRTKR